MKVLHVASQLIPRSETFVQRRLSARATTPFALGWERVEGGLEVPCPSLSLPLAKDVPGRSDWKSLGGKVARVRRRMDLVEVLRRLLPDVVHAHFGWAATSVERECRLLGLPLVATFYGKDISKDLRAPGVREAYDRLFASAAGLTAEGPALARRLIGARAPVDRVKLLPLALPDWALAAPEKNIALDDPTFRLLQVSRFVGKKGIETTFRALAIARDRLAAQAEKGADIPGASARVFLTLVGDGPLRADLEALAAELKLGEIVNWAGFRPYDELPTFLANHHVFIHPSRTPEDGDGEGGAPSALTEAQAQGVPIIGTTHDDLPTVVRNGVTGLLSAEGDAEAVAQSIVNLATNRELVARMAERARPFVLRRHDPERMIRLRERIYRRAVARYQRDGAGPSVLGRWLRKPGADIDSWFRPPSGR